MSDAHEEVTKAAEEAREMRDTVLALALALVIRAIEAGDFAGLAACTLEESFDVGGVAWSVSAVYSPKHGGVRVFGGPELPTAVENLTELARLMGGDQARFDFSVPTAWARAAWEVPVDAVVEDEEEGPVLVFVEGAELSAEMAEFVERFDTRYRHSAFFREVVNEAAAENMVMNDATAEWVAGRIRAREDQARREGGKA